MLGLRMQYLAGNRNSTDSYTVCILSIGSLKAHPDSDTLPLAGPDLLIVSLPLGEPCSFKLPQGGIFVLILFTKASFPQFSSTASGIFCRYSYQVKEASFGEICRDAVEIARVGRT